MSFGLIILLHINTMKEFCIKKSITELKIKMIGMKHFLGLNLNVMNNIHIKISDRIPKIYKMFLYDEENQKKYAKYSIDFN